MEYKLVLDCKKVYTTYSLPPPEEIVQDICSQLNFTQGTIIQMKGFRNKGSFMIIADDEDEYERIKDSELTFNVPKHGPRKVKFIEISVQQKKE